MGFVESECKVIRLSYNTLLFGWEVDDDAIHKTGNTEDSLRRAGFGYIEHEMSTEY